MLSRRTASRAADHARASAAVDRNNWSFDEVLPECSRLNPHANNPLERSLNLAAMRGRDSPNGRGRGAFEVGVCRAEIGLVMGDDLPSADDFEWMLACCELSRSQAHLPLSPTSSRNGQPQQAACVGAECSIGHAQEL
jgi:hypothetical protein